MKIYEVIRLYGSQLRAKYTYTGAGLASGPSDEDTTGGPGLEQAVHVERRSILGYVEKRGPL
jgi:hypothetical protein